MGAILMWSRAEFRQRWRAWLGLAILIGLFGGVVLAAAAGARRTNSSWDRFLESSRAWDAVTFYVAWDPSFAELDPDEVEALPSVAEHARGRFFPSADDLLTGLGPDDTYATSMNRPRFLEGRRPDVIDEISLPYALSIQLGLHAGDQLTIPFREGSEKQEGENVVERELRVVGVHLSAGPGEFPPGGGRENGMILMSRAFTQAHATDLANFPVGFFRLHRGSEGIEKFRDEIETVAGGKPFFVQAQPDSALIANKAVHLVALGLWVLGAALALVAVLALGQALARQFFLEGERFPTGRALGLTGPQMFAIGMVRAVSIGIAAAAIAVAVAVALSPLAPIGIARVAEPTPGLATDWFALGLGAFGVIAVVALISVIPAWRAERSVGAQGRRVTRRSRVARAAFRAGLPAPAVTGIRLALEPGRGRTAVPIRSTLGAATVGIAAVIIASTFGASLNHLLTAGDAYGITWDSEVEVRFDPNRGTELTAAVAERVRGLEGIRDAVVADSGIPLRVAGIPVVSLAMDLSHRTVAPPLRRGRYPAGADEITLGEKTIRTIGAKIGETIEVELEGLKPKPFTVVGVAMIPGYDTQSGLGEGGLLDPSAVTRFLESAPPVTSIFVRYSDGADHATMEKEISKIADVSSVSSPPLPEELRNLQRIDSMPAILAGVLALLAAAAIAHGLASSVRRRSRDLAILLALGFVRGQVRATVAWQSLTFAVASLVLGIPIGIGIGRWVWTASANEIGVLPVPVVPSVVLGVVVGGAMAVALSVSAFPARTAARTRPAAILRAE